MPRVIGYPQVLQQMSRQGFRSLYHNSGAFGFAEGISPQVFGWIGPEDSTIRAAAAKRIRRVDPPFEANLAAMFVRAWTGSLPGPLWIMPQSHWSFELEFGSPDWMPRALREIGIDPEALESKNTGSAIEFQMSEPEIAQLFVQRLLENLTASDFTAVFPDHPAICTLHHHKQIWWQTTDTGVLATLD